MTRAPRSALAATAGLALATGGLAVWRGEDLVAAGVGLVALVALGALLRPFGAGRTDAAPAPAQPGRSDPVLSGLPLPVILVDRRSVVVEANPEAQGVVPGLRSGQPLAFALRAPEILDGLREVLAGGGRTEVEFGGRGAMDRSFQVFIRPLPGGPGSGTAAAMLVFRDLTAERRLQVMRSDFIATVSHELRTPLASLSGFIDTLAGPARDDPAARARFLGIMRAQADRMTRLVGDLLRLSRVELNVHHAPETPIALGPVVRHMLEILGPMARERRVEIATAIEEEDGLLVLGDRDELLRVVENLVENAVKYGGRGGRVEVSLRRSEDGRAVDLAVQDHGDGIAAEHLPRLTERFYRVDVGESRREGGTGLGLAIVKHIVVRHRGRLRIESEPGQGLRVSVRLPAAP